MKKIKTIMVGNSECTVETLREWINGRMVHLRQAKRTSEFHDEKTDFGARLAELSIIREKINDGRIQEIG